MISKGLRKKPATSPPTQPNIKKKSKSKSKQKSKKFNAKEFLQALIDLQNTNCSTNKKKRNTTRDISSALTVATPLLEKTISASKIRSKSSFSQHRKKCAGGPKQPMNINLCAIITEQDNVQYTQKTARSNNQENESKINQLNHQNIDYNKKVNENLCATRIQRAWRNYQTYKIVHQIYLRQRRSKQLKDKKNNNIANLVHIKVKKPDFEKTLRIKRQHAAKKQERKQQQFSQTQKILKERYSEEQKKKISKGQSSPIQQFTIKSYESELSSSIDQSAVLQKMKQRQAQMLKQVIDMIEKQGNHNGKEDLIHKLIQKCQNNKKILEEDYSSPLEPIKFEESECNQEQVIKNKRKKSEEENPNNKEQSLLSVHSPSQSSLIQSFDHDNYDADHQQVQIFQQRLKNIKQEKIKRLEEIDDEVLDSRISNNQAFKKKQKIYTRYDKQTKQISKIKKQYLFSLSKLKKCAISCKKSALQENSSLTKIRKSFSVGSTVIKQVLEDLKLLDIVQIQNEDSCKWLFKREQAVPSQNSKPLTTTPILQLPSPNKGSQSQEQLLQRNNNTQVMKEYSEQIQELIEKQLIEQFVTSIFVDDNLFQYFKPYIEEIYEFHKINDTEIHCFPNAIKTFMPSQQTMLRRVNQKINPTSLQILRIIRDLDYETDEYQLIIPQQCFKKYRANIEKNFEEQNSKEQINFKELSLNYKDVEVAQKVYRLELQKREKMKKYRNFERDLKIMYMKSVFNCINEFMIELKSSNAFMNARSSIGPGQLTLALKQYNQTYEMMDYHKLVGQVQSKLSIVISNKCSIPSFKNYYDIEQFQRQVMKQIQVDSCQNQFKWVNYMDQVLEIWQDLSTSIIQDILQEAYTDILKIFQ